MKIKHHIYCEDEFKYLLRFGNVSYLSLLKLLFISSYLKTYTLRCTCCSALYLSARKTRVPESPRILYVYYNVY